MGRFHPRSNSMRHMKRCWRLKQGDLWRLSRDFNATIYLVANQGKPKVSRRRCQEWLWPCLIDRVSRCWEAIHDRQLREYYKLHWFAHSSWFLGMRMDFFLWTNLGMVTCFPGNLSTCRCCGRILSWRPLAMCGADFGCVRFGGECNIDYAQSCLW